MELLSLEVITPQGKQVECTADEITCPGVAGNIGLLPGHLPLLAPVHTGILFWRQGGETTYAAIRKGFVNVQDNRVVVLTEGYAVRDTLDPVLLRRELHQVQDDLKLSMSPPPPTEEPFPVPEAIEQAKEAQSALLERQAWLSAQLFLHGDAEF